MTEDIYRTGAYLEKNPTLHTGESPWKVAHIAAMLRRHDLAPRSVCDAGCGAGLILQLLEPHLPPDAILHGYDISPQAVERCRLHETARRRYFCQDLLAAGTEPYDLLLAIDVFEHVPDYLGFLHRLRAKAALKIFHVPLELCAMAAVSRRWLPESREQAGHLHYFNRETALAALRDTGYEIVDWFYTPAYELCRRERGRRDRLLRLLFRFASADLTARVLGGYSLLVLAR